MKYLKQTLNSIDELLMSLVMSYVGSKFKVLSISWYISMKQFLTNMKLVINKYLCRWHKYFPGVDYSSNNIMLSGISKYISPQNYISIWFVFLYLLKKI